MTDKSQVRNQVNAILDFYNFLEMPFINEQARADCIRKYIECNPSIEWYVTEYFNDDMRLATPNNRTRHKGKQMTLRTVKWREGRGILTDEF